MFILSPYYNNVAINLVPGYFSHVVQVARINWNNRELVEVTRA